MFCFCGFSENFIRQCRCADFPTSYSDPVFSVHLLIDVNIVSGEIRFLTEFKDHLKSLTWTIICEYKYTCAPKVKKSAIECKKLCIIFQLVKFSLNELNYTICI